ncbi:hypothetical protein LTR95_000811 [Oleoguttula sp. CCFEE 5521]
MSDTTHTTPASAAPLEKLENTVEPTTATSHVAEPSFTSATSPAVPETSATTETAPINTASDAVKHDDTVLGGAADGALPQIPTTTTATESKAIEPVSEGHLGYKAPGLLKQFIFSQKEFWISDAPLTPQHLHLYLRGEKSEVAHPVAAWATHTGKGLLFFNKKGESERSHPAGILPLYEATDLKKSSPHEFSFEIHGHKHQFKATSDAERDGWYLAIEKEVELAKASKETVRGSDGYKSEMEKLNAPNVIGGVAGATKSSTLPKKSTEVTEPRRTGSSESEGEGLQKKSNKSRSTSRGVLNRLKGKKEEAETKKEIKKEEKEEAKEEKKIEKEEKKIEKEEAKAEKHGEHGSALPFIGGTSAPLDAHSAADRAVGAPIAETKHEEPVNALPATNGATPTKIDERAKPTKRNSIFGKLPGAFGGLMSPSKEKSEREAELKPTVPPKDHSVSETAPQLPETTATEPIESVAPTTTGTTEPIKPEIHEPAPVTEPTTKTTDAVTPGKEKKSFLSGLPFLGKRDRSVSPSPALKDNPAKTETSALPTTEQSAPVEPTPVEPIKAAEPVTETPATLADTTHNTTSASPIEPTTESKAIDPVHETTPTDTTSPAGANKRNSVFGNLGRRASKALNRMQSTPNSKKENAIPGATESTPKTTTTAADETLPSTTTTDKATESSLTDPVIENKPETVGTSSHTPVTASA